MAKNGKRTNEGEGSSSASPPLKRQKIAAASSSTVVTDGTAARIRQLEQRLQRIQDKRKITIKDCKGCKSKRKRFKDKRKITTKD